ncbi:LOW QUALITY PROTEIN: hypothetical protein Cgig2_010665 [Carnegiea gigantea]|uniref:Uncharacterized protein n=1 Tax=Carnegiea gigantea TaxID=171969 RepID=A0A9Q1JJC1_9CARY|nr:LOW QUALITY PROTEIN: hypothetical protein Cgig2_010665 [Carnegiea gigantea]
MGFRGFLHLQANMISGKLALWLVRNFDTSFCSLPLTHGRMTVTKHDVHTMLGLPKGSPEVVEPKNNSNVSVDLLNYWKQQWLERDSIPKCGEVIEMMQCQVDEAEDFRKNFVMLLVSTCLRGNQRGELCYLDHVVFKLRSVPCQFLMLRVCTNGEIKSRVGQEFIIRFGGGYLEDTLNSMRKKLMKRNIAAKVMKMKLKPRMKQEFQRTLFRDGRNQFDNNSNRLLAEVITKLEELIPRARTPLKRIRKVAAKLTSDALISKRPNKSNSRILVLLQDSYESEGFLMDIEKHFVGSRATFTPPSFSLGVSHEEKEALPKGVVIVDLEPDIPIAKV